MRLRNQLSEKFLISSIAAGMAFSIPFSASASTKVQLPSADFKTKQVFRYGQFGHEIKRLQMELNAQKYYVDEIDGYFGESTLEAVKQFQEANNLTVNGIADPVTLSILFKSPEIKEYLELNKQSVRVGDQGAKVIALQKKLNKLDYLEAKVDGVFGRKTEQAVINYQSDHNLTIDGVAGNEVFSHLNSDHHNHAKPVRKVAGSGIKIKKVQTTSSVNTELISIAKSFMGTPYKWGGTSPSGFDCSGFLQFVYHQAGSMIPRTVSDIWNFGVDVNKPSVGDLVFFETYKAGPSHAGIYLGNGQFIHAGSSTGVTISELSMDYWAKRYLGAKRVIKH